MSDNWIIVIPESPDYVPSEAAQERAAALLRSFAPRANKIEATTSKKIRFIDCGGNFERIVCPACASEVDVDWWSDCMSKEFESDFPLRAVQLPCCGTAKALNQLIYEWPQGFARFSLEAMNANIGELAGERREELERVLGCRLIVIYRHL
jgi:hypothetical protein